MNQENKPTILAVGDGSQSIKLRKAIVELMKQDFEQKEHQEKEQDEEER